VYDTGFQDVDREKMSQDVEEQERSDGLQENERGRRGNAIKGGTMVQVDGDQAGQPKLFDVVVV